MSCLRIFFPDTDESVIVKKSQHEPHDEADQRGLPDDLKKTVREQMKLSPTAKKTRVKLSVKTSEVV